MSRDSGSGVGAIVVIVVGLFMLGVWKLSTALGADFQITLDAVIRSIPVVLIAGAAIWFLKPDIFTSFAGTAAGLWPVWWRVIDSIAAGGKNPDTAFMFEQPWWDTGWVKWGVEFALLGLVVWLIVRSHDRY